MSNHRIYLSQAHLGGKEASYVLDFANNWIDVKGENILAFENELGDFLGQNVHVAALSSGTAALHLGLVLLGVQTGDEVICQSMTFSASANPIMYLGATPVFIDSESETWNMCPKALEEAILDRISKGRKPKAIIAVHLYGMPFKIDEIKLVAQKYEIPILEDSAEALGSIYKDQKCGSFGDVSILSFNGNKIITTSGGGALISNDKKVKEKAIFLATQARDHAPHYQHSEIGYNYRMSNVCAGIGRGQMEVLEQHITLRREMHQSYFDFFTKIDGVKILTEPTAHFYSNHWLSAIVIDAKKTGGKTSVDLRLALEKANIESRPLWKPMHLQPIFERYAFYGDKISQDLFENGLCLPSGSNITQEEKNRIFTELQRFF